MDLVGQRMRSYESEVGTKQSCSYEVIHFYKKLYFNPGIYAVEAVYQNEGCEDNNISETSGKALSTSGPRTENIFCEIADN